MGNLELRILASECVRLVLHLNMHFANAGSVKSPYMRANALASSLLVKDSYSFWWNFMIYGMLRTMLENLLSYVIIFLNSGK